MMHGQNMLLGHKSQMLWLWACVLSAHLNEIKVNAFTLLSSSAVLSGKLPYLRSCALCVDFTKVAGAKAKSSFHLVSPVCINVEDLLLADRFSLIVESKDFVPARQLCSPSLAPQRASLWSDIAADQRRKNTVNRQFEPLKVQLTFLPLSDRGRWLWFLAKRGQTFWENLDRKVSQIT